MKTKNLWLILALLITSMAFTACEKNDDEKETTEVAMGETSIVLKMNVTNSSLEKQIAVQAQAFSINWGDGSEPGTWTSSASLLTIPNRYKEAGEYTVKISGYRLTGLSFPGMDITSVTFERAPRLKKLFANDNSLEDINLRKADSLSYVNCSNNKLTNITVAGHSNITSLICEANVLYTLNVSNCKKMSVLQIGAKNPLRELNASYCPDIETLALNKLSTDTVKTRLQSLNVKGSTGLKTLWVERNNLSILDLSSNTKLESLICYANELTRLNFKSENLTQLRCHHNRLDLAELYVIVDQMPIIYDGRDTKVCLDENTPEALKTEMKRKQWRLYDIWWLPLS